MSLVIEGTIIGYRIFNELDTEFIYVNEQLLNGRSLTKIAIEDYGYKSESSLRKELTRGSLYKRVGQDVTGVENTSVLGCREFNGKRGIIMSSSVIDNRFEGLLSNYDVLMKRIEEYKYLGMQGVNDNRLVIELPAENKEARITFRINEEFKDFAKDYKQFKVKELVSSALQEFVNKYK